MDRYYDPNTDQFLSIDPDVAKTGQPYAYTGDDPLNATDPLGLDKVYILRHKNGKIYYVGRTNKPPRRTQEHIRSGLLNPKNGDSFQELKTGELSPREVKGVEQITINTLRSTGAPLNNKINAISPKNPMYAETIEEGNRVFLRSPNALLAINEGSVGAAAEQFQRMIFQGALGVSGANLGVTRTGAPEGGDVAPEEIPPLDF